MVLKEEPGFTETRGNVRRRLPFSSVSPLPLPLDHDHHGMAPSMHDKPREDDGDYEREGLLTGTDSEAYLEKGEIPAQPTWSRNKLMGVAVGFIVLLVCGITAKHALYAPRYHPNMFFNGDEVRSNGTHDFKRTVLIVSIDGLRCAGFYSLFAMRR